jgi:zinc D-Ala-D-Ala dipeptidase
MRHSALTALSGATIWPSGFVNYLKAWWHFSMPGAGGPAYDFPFKPRHN